MKSFSILSVDEEFVMRDSKKKICKVLLETSFFLFFIPREYDGEGVAFDPATMVTKCPQRVAAVLLNRGAISNVMT